MAVCVSVTVVQNKFYLSLLYPALDLALREPCPDRSQADLSGTKPEREACSPPPPQPVRAAGSGGHTQGQTPGSVTTSRGFLPMALPFPPLCPLLHRGKNMALNQADPGLSPGTIY